MRKKLFDILVVGNGILGLSTAYSLAREDSSLRIGYIAPSSHMEGATLAAGAMLGCFGEITHSTFESKHAQAKFKMAVDSAALWPSWITELNALVDKVNHTKINFGTFILLNNKSGKHEDKNFSAIIKGLNLYQEPYELVEAQNIPGLDPVDDCRPLRALFLPKEGQILPLQLLSTLRIAMNQFKNIKIIESTVKKIHTTEKRIASVIIENGTELKTSHVILATGAYTQQLIDQIPDIKEYIPRIFSGVGTSLILKSTEHTFKNVIRSPNRAGSCGIHLMPTNMHLDYLFIGASNNIRISPLTQPKARDVYYLLERAMEQFDQKLHKAELIKWNVGNRPVTIDTYPLIGETSITGLYLLTGTYRDGLHNAPLLAMSLAKKILGKTNSLFDNLFLPERQAIASMTKAEAIEEACEHYMSAAYEHSIKMPKIGWNDIFKEMWQKRIQALYNELEIDFGLSPDILIMLEQEKALIPKFKEYCKIFIENYNSSTYKKKSQEEDYSVL